MGFERPEMLPLLVGTLPCRSGLLAPNASEERNDIRLQPRGNQVRRPRGERCPSFAAGFEGKQNNYPS